MPKIHLDIWKKVRPDLIDLSKHFIITSLTIITFWFVIKIIDFLFQTIPITIKIFSYIAEIAIILHYVKDSINNLLK
jgi:hypothetical protein